MRKFTLFLALVIFAPWDKLSSWLECKIFREYFIPAIVTLLIIIPTWNILISIFPTTDPYKQLLRTGEATIEVIAEPNGVIGGMRSYAGLGRILLIKDENIILEMNAAAARQQLENNQVRFFARPGLYLKDVSINKPISKITEAETAIISFEKLPPNSKILEGEIVLVFNSSVRIVIPVPPQTMKNGAIIIKDVQKYFKKI